MIPTVRSGYDAASAQARQLNATYGVTQKVDMGLAYALSKAAALTERAMQNPTLAAVVTSGKQFLTEAANAVNDTLRAARLEAGGLHPAAGQGVAGAGQASGQAAGGDGQVGLPSAAAAAAHDHAAPTAAVVAVSPPAASTAAPNLL